MTDRTVTEPNGSESIINNTNRRLPYNLRNVNANAHCSLRQRTARCGRGFFILPRFVGRAGDAVKTRVGDEDIMRVGDEGIMRVEDAVKMRAE